MKFNYPRPQIRKSKDGQRYEFDHARYLLENPDQLNLNFSAPKKPENLEKTIEKTPPISESAQAPPLHDDDNIQYPGKPGHREHAKDTLGYRHRAARQELLETGAITLDKPSKSEERDYQANKS